MIRKISIKGETVTIQREEHKDGRVEVIKTVGTDKPRPEFAEAMRALREHVIDICQFPAKYGQNVDVRGITLSEDGEVKKCSIQAFRKVEKANAPFNINVPQVIYSTDQTVILETAIETLTTEADKYLNGQRSQQSLKLEEAEGDEAPDVPEDEEADDLVLAGAEA